LLLNYIKKFEKNTLHFINTSKHNYIKYIVVKWDSTTL
jgi:hypothetical protein